MAHAINSANRAKQGISLIRKYFSENELVRLSTAYFYGRLYYGAKVWLHSGLGGLLKRKLWQASSRMLQLIDKSETRGISYLELHKKYGRATPNMWGNYITAVCMYDMVCGKTTMIQSVCGSLNLLHNTRRQGPIFTRSNKLKIGFNFITNRLQVVSNRLNQDWTIMSKMNYKMLCKTVFIKNELK